MQTVNGKIINIGKSRGVRIPKALLKVAGFGNSVSMEAKANELIIRPVRRPREGWAESIQQLGPDDCPLDDYIPNEFDESEWVW